MNHVLDGVQVPVHEGVFLRAKRSSHDTVGYVRRSIYSKPLSREQLQGYGAQANWGAQTGLALAQPGEYS